MDEDDGDLDDPDIEGLTDEPDGMFVGGHVVMPDGSLLCLCGRDPGSDGVIREIAMAAALIVEFDLLLGGCVMDAAASYDRIHDGLKTGPARRLRRRMHAARQFVEAAVLEGAGRKGSFVTGSRLTH